MLVQGGQRLPGHLSRQLCYPSLSRVHFLGVRCLRHVSLRRSDNPTPRFPPPGPHGLGSPASTVLSGRYDFLPFLPPRFVALTPAVPSQRSYFARSVAERCHGRSSGVGNPVSPAGILSME